MGKMTVYDLVKENYAKVKSSDSVMWQTTQLLSDAVLPMMDTNPEHYWKLIKDLYCTMVGPHYNEDFAEWQVSEMHHKDKSGTVHKGEYWSIAQTTPIFENIRSRIPNTYNKYDFYVVMNMMYHDYGCMIKEWYPELDGDGLAKRCIDMSIAYLADADSEDGKIWNYLNK